MGGGGVGGGRGSQIKDSLVLLLKGGVVHLGSSKLRSEKT